MCIRDLGQTGIQSERATLPAPSRSEPVLAAPPAPPEPLTTLRDREILALRSFPIVGVLALVLGVATLIFSLAEQRPGLFFGALPVTVAFAFVYLGMRPLPLRIRCSVHGLHFGPKQVLLPYSRIQEIFAPQRSEKSRRFPIQLLCDGGPVALPAKLSVASEDLYRFLISQRLGAKEIPSLHPIFGDFLKQQRAIHSPESIYVYTVRRPDWPTYLPRTWRHNGWRRFALALLLSNAFAGAVAAVPGPFGETAGVLCLLSPFGIFGLFLFVASFSRRPPRRLAKGLATATLIVTPSGLAMDQGELRGELRWHELRGLKETGAFDAPVTNQHSGPGLQLQIAGAMIGIPDIYHWPLAHIGHVIRAYADIKVG